jgi:hypothetical protein
LNRLYFSVFIFSASLILACTAAKKSSIMQSDADRGASIFPGLTLVDLEKGKAAYEKNCQTCHNLKRPSAYSESQWKNLVPKMSAMANKKAGSSVVTEEDKTKILQYVVTMCKQ